MPKYCVVTATPVVCYRRIRYFKPIYKFRVHYLYSNMHYGIVSYLAQVLGGKVYEDLIQEHFYTPLGRINLGTFICFERAC